MTTPDPDGRGFADPSGLRQEPTMLDRAEFIDQPTVTTPDPVGERSSALRRAILNLRLSAAIGIVAGTVLWFAVGGGIAEVLSGGLMANATYDLFLANHLDLS